MPTITVPVSQNTYDELMTFVERENVQLNENDTIIFKNTKIVAPVNYKQVQIRRDCAQIAAQAYKKDIKYSNGEQKDFIEFVEEIYQYVLNGYSTTQIRNERTNDE